MEIEMDFKFWQSLKYYEFTNWKISKKSWNWLQVCLFIYYNLNCLLN